jgi:hypothetical protein
MNHPDLLQKTAEAFECWRQQRTHKAVPIPDSLRHQAIQLLDSHAISQVTKALRLCSAQLKAWRLQFAYQTEQPTEFVTLPVTSEQHSAPHLELELKLSNHNSLLMRGEVTPELLHLFIQQARQS